MPTPICEEWVSKGLLDRKTRLVGGNRARYAMSMTVRRFYPDTNVVQLIRTRWEVAEFDERAHAAGVRLGLGSHVIYELARGFILPKPPPDIQAAFQFLSSIEAIELLPTIDQLIDAEFHLANVGLPIVTVLDPENQRRTREEIVKLARGDADAARHFIGSREPNVLREHAATGRANVGITRSFFAAHPAVRRRVKKSFESFRAEVYRAAPADLEDLANQHKIRVHPGAFTRVLAEPQRFPVLNTWLNANWYSAYIAAVYRKVPSPDKRDDFRHLVDSATCDLFVTNDGPLQKQGEQISPYRPVVTWTDFAPSVELGLAVGSAASLRRKAPRSDRQY